MTNSQSTTKSNKRNSAVTLNNEVLAAVNNVDSVFYGLGIPTALHYTLVKSGASIMTIGTMGTGKGVIKNLLSPADSFSIDLDSVTKTDLANKLGDIQDMKVHVSIEELASLSEYQRGILTDVLAKVISDRNYQSDSSKINIVNCEMTMYCGVQPMTFTQMIAQSSAWENLTNDRFIKIMLVNGLRKDDIERFDVNKEWYLDVHKQFNDLFRIDTKSIEVEPKALTIIHRLLMNQISGNRVLIYAKKILQAWASMNNATVATVKLAELFVKLFGFYFMIFDTFTLREDIGANLKFQGALTTTFMAVSSNQRFNFTKQDYVSMFRVDESTLRRNISQLAEMQLIEIYNVPVQTPAGKRQAQAYRLGGKVQEYFNYYVKVTTPKKPKKKRATKK